MLLPCGLVHMQQLLGAFLSYMMLCILVKSVCTWRSLCARHCTHKDVSHPHIHLVRMAELMRCTTACVMVQASEQIMAGCMTQGTGFNLPGLSPQAAAALQFWLTQGALNPNVHANFLHSLQGPFGNPMGHHFSGLSRTSLHPDSPAGP